MAGITKLYLTAEQQEKLRTWMHHHAFRIMLLTFKNPYRYFYSLPDEAHKDERYTRKKYPATNFPEKIDRYLMRYCKLSFIREGLKEQYTNWYQKLLNKKNITPVPFSRKTKREISEITSELISIIVCESNYNDETSLTEIDNGQHSRIKELLEGLTNPYHDNRDGEIHIFNWDKITEIGSKYNVFEKYIKNNHISYVYDNPFSVKPKKILFSYFSSYYNFNYFTGDTVDFECFTKQLKESIISVFNKIKNKELKEMCEFLKECQEKAFYGIYEIWT